MSIEVKKEKEITANTNIFGNVSHLPGKKKPTASNSSHNKFQMKNTRPKFESINDGSSAAVEYVFSSKENKQSNENPFTQEDEPEFDWDGLAGNKKTVKQEKQEKNQIKPHHISSQVSQKSNTSQTQSVSNQQQNPFDYNENKPRTNTNSNNFPDSIAETISRKPSGGSSKASATEIKHITENELKLRVQELETAKKELEILLETEKQKMINYEEEVKRLRQVNSELKIQGISNNENYIKLELERVKYESSFLKKENEILKQEVEELNKHNRLLETALEAKTGEISKSSIKEEEVKNRKKPGLPDSASDGGEVNKSAVSQKSKKSKKSKNKAKNKKIISSKIQYQPDEDLFYGEVQQNNIEENVIIQESNKPEKENENENIYENKEEKAFIENIEEKEEKEEKEKKQKPEEQEIQEDKEEIVNNSNSNNNKATTNNTNSNFQSNLFNDIPNPFENEEKVEITNKNTMISKPPQIKAHTQAGKPVKSLKPEKPVFKKQPLNNESNKFFNDTDEPNFLFSVPEKEKEKDSTIISGKSKKQYSEDKEENTNTNFAETEVNDANEINEINDKTDIQFLATNENLFTGEDEDKKEKSIISHKSQKSNKDYGKSEFDNERDDDLQHSKINHRTTNNNLFEDDDDNQTIADILNKSKMTYNNKLNTPVSHKQQPSEMFKEKNTAKNIFDSENEDGGLFSNMIKNSNINNKKEKEKEKDNNMFTQLNTNPTKSATTSTKPKIPQPNLNNLVNQGQGQAQNTQIQGNNQTAVKEKTSHTALPKPNLSLNNKQNSNKNSNKNNLEANLFDNDDDFESLFTKPKPAKQGMNIPERKLINKPHQQKTPTPITPSQPQKSQNKTNTTATDLFNDMDDYNYEDDGNIFASISTKEKEKSLNKSIISSSSTTKQSNLPTKPQLQQMQDKQNNSMVNNIFDSFPDADFGVKNLKQQKPSMNLNSKVGPPQPKLKTPSNQNQSAISGGSKTNSIKGSGNIGNNNKQLLKGKIISNEDATSFFD